MTNVETLREEIRKLVEKYKDMESKLGEAGLKKLSEANVRAAFINPLFIALGWKTDDPMEYDDESYVRGAGYVDIALRLGERTLTVKPEAKVFIEAKKFGGIPSIKERGKQKDLLGNWITGDWTDEERQVLNYAAAQKIKWAILTNFEKFRLYNAVNGLTILNIENVDEYGNRINDLLYLTKDSVSSGRIEDLAKREELPDVDLNFLSLLKKWRIEIARDIYNLNPTIRIDGKDEPLTLEMIREATQRVLDRFIVVRFAEDRLILDSPDLLRDTYTYWKKHKDYGSLFDMFFGKSRIFHKFDEKYNSKIFERDHICEKVSISDNVIGNIIDGLYTVNFRKFTSDILGNTYETYLGEKLAVEAGKLIAQPSMETRKEEGIYYTPRYIVNYIVDKTVKVKIEEIWKHVEKLFEAEKYDEAQEKFAEISKIKVLDPALGSGSFQIRAFAVFKEYYEAYNDKIKEIRRKLTNAAEASKNVKLHLYTTMPQIITDYEKKILKENIYGVDLDPLAAEISAVNLMLQALKEGEKLPLILQENIKVGNSLITGVVNGLEQYRDEIKKLIELREKLKELDKDKKGVEGEENAIKEGTNKAINESLKEREENEKKVGFFTDVEAEKPFNWQIEFPEAFLDGSGFDVVIGNPPYGAELTEEERNYIGKTYPASKSYKNTALTFIELAHRLVKEGGYVGMIVPKSLTYSQKWHTGRELAKEDLEFIADASKAFKEVLLEQVIIILKKGSKGGNYVIQDVWEPGKSDTVVDKKFIDETLSLIVHGDPVDLEIFKKMNTNCKHLRDISRTSRGLPFQKHVTKSKTKYPVFRGADVARYLLRETDEYLEEKYVDGNLEKVRFLKQPKVISQRIVAHVTKPKDHIILMSTLDRDGVLSVDTVENTVVTDKDYSPEFLLCLLNSKRIYLPI